MSDAPFSATGWSERDRLTRLETLQVADAQSVKDLRQMVTGMDSKLDKLLDQASRRAGIADVVGTVLRPAGTVLWAAVLGFLGWAASAYLSMRGPN